MNVRYSLSTAILILLVLTSSVFGEQSTEATGIYERDLGQVYGAMKSFEFMKEICAEAYPDYIEKNELAYKKWQEKYKPFLQEIQKRYSIVMWNVAGGDAERYDEVIGMNEIIFKGIKQAIKLKMKSDGEKVFRRTCEDYPSYLMTDQANLEHFHADQVSTIRKEPME